MLYLEDIQKIATLFNEVKNVLWKISQLILEFLLNIDIFLLIKFYIYIYLFNKKY